MSAQHARAAQCERRAAEALGTRRRIRSRYESAPDMDPIALPCGIVLQPEVKTRRKLATITKWLEQARAYMPNATPLVVASEKGGPQIAILPLEAFARIAGIEKAAA